MSNESMAIYNLEQIFVALNYYLKILKRYRIKCTYKINFLFTSRKTRKKESFLLNFILYLKYNLVETSF